MSKADLYQQGQEHHQLASKHYDQACQAGIRQLDSLENAELQYAQLEMLFAIYHQLRSQR